jgi:hypothetical protein
LWLVTVIRHRRSRGRTTGFGVKTLPQRHREHREEKRH